LAKLKSSSAQCGGPYQRQHHPPEAAELGAAVDAADAAGEQACAEHSSGLKQTASSEFVSW
jgi:hypothetical protein